MSIERLVAAGLAVLCAILGALYLNAGGGSASLTKQSTAADVAAIVAGIEPYGEAVLPSENGTLYDCGFYDDAPDPDSLDFTWSVRVCVIQGADAE